MAPHESAEVRTLQARHQPVGHHDVRAVLLEQLPGFGAVGCRDGLVANTFNGLLQNESFDVAVFGDQDAHAYSSASSRASACTSSGTRAMASPVCPLRA